VKTVLPFPAFKSGSFDVLTPQISTFPCAMLPLPPWFDNKIILKSGKKYSWEKRFAKRK